MTLNAADHTRLVYKAAKHIGVRDADIIGAGMVALVEACQRFDPSLGYQPSTFLFKSVTGAMLDALRDAPIVSPYHSREGRKASYGKATPEVQEECDAVRFLSCDRQTEESGATFGETPAPADVDAMSAADWFQLLMDADVASKSWAVINASMPTLSARCKRIFEGMREGKSYAEIGAELGVTRQRVGQDALKVLQHFRSELEEAEII